MPPKGYSKALAKNALPDSVEVQSLLQEIADLKSALAEKPQATEPQTDVNAALLAFLSKGAVSTKPVDYKLTLNKPYTFTEKRKQEIEAIFKGGFAEKQKNGAMRQVSYVADKGIEWQWDGESPSVTFRRQTTVRSFDEELQMWVKAKVFVAESLHASTADRTFILRLRELCRLA